MSEGKGYAVIAKFNLVPVGQYASGNSLIVQGDTPDEVATLIAKLIPGGNDDNGALILAAFANTALAQSVVVTLSGPPAAAPAATEGAAPVVGLSIEPASAALRKVAAKKVGKTVEELGDISTAEAKALIKGE